MMFRSRRIFPALLRMACLMALWLGASGMLSAQETQKVLIYVKDKSEGSIIKDQEVRVYGFEDADLAMKAYQVVDEAISTGKQLMLERYYASTRDTNYVFELYVPSDGVVMAICLGAKETIKTFPVNKRDKITIYFDTQNVLDAATARPKPDPIPEVGPPQKLGDTLNLSLKYPIKRRGRSTARLAAQVFLHTLDDNPDSMEFLKSFVWDGEEYHMTQLRRMGFHASNDSIWALAEPYHLKKGWLNDTLYSQTLEFEMAYSCKKNRKVLIDCKLWFEDYNREYFQDIVRLADTRRLQDAMRFLDYSVHAFALNPNAPEYFRRAESRSVNGSKDLSLTFAPSKSQLDPKDTASLSQLGELLDLFRSFQDKSQEKRLVYYEVIGTASPDGIYASNLSLANRRMEYIGSQIRTACGKNGRSRASVATWEQMADTLDALSYGSVAEAIRRIIRKFPGKIDVQSKLISDLRNPVISDNLWRLRSVRVNYRFEERRSLTDSEILGRFLHNPNFHSGKEEFYPNEYWTLFKLIQEGKVKDLKDQETIYRRAVSLAKRMDPHWQLPDNLLASFLIARHQPDTMVLSRFVDHQDRFVKRISPTDSIVFWCDLPRGSYVKNPSPLVANQVVMMLANGFTARAAQLVEMLPRAQNEEYQQLYYITRCLAGYWHPKNADSQDIYRVIRATSPRNACVMDLALAKFDLVPLDLLKMPDEDPLTHYLKAQYLCKKYQTLYKRNSWADMALENGGEEDQTEALISLAQCFRRDSTFVKVAFSDYDIYEDLIQVAVEKSKEPEVDPEKEEIVVPPGLSYDDFNKCYVDERFDPYEYKEGKFINMVTGKEYVPKK